MQKSFGILLFISMFALTGCFGQNAKKIVTDLNYDVRDSDQYEKYAHVDFQLNLGNAELPMASYNLPNDLGMVSLSLVDGKNVVTVDLNLTEALKLPVGEAKLPNGNPLPIYSSNGVIYIDIEQINGRVYLAHNGDQTVIGFAMAISQLDGVGRELGGVGLFPSFTVKNVKVVAGVFSDKEQGQTGIAAFADLKGLLGDLAEPANGKLFFYRYKYSRRLIKKANRLLNEYKTQKQVLTPAPRY